MSADKFIEKLEAGNGGIYVCVIANEGKFHRQLHMEFTKSHITKTEVDEALARAGSITHFHNENLEKMTDEEYKEAYIKAAKEASQ